MDDLLSRPASLDASARWLADRATAWDRRLAALKRAAEMPAPQTRPDNSTPSDNNK